MKKQFYILLLAFVALTLTKVQAQGSFVGLDLGFSSTSDVGSSFNIGPTYGYKLSSTMQIVAGVNFGSETIKRTPDDEKISSLGIGAEFRYGTRPADNFFLFGALGVRYNSGKREIGNNESDQSAFSVGIRPGIDYMFNDKWSITSYFGFLGLDSETVGDADAVNTFGLDLSMSTLGFALFYHF